MKETQLVKRKEHICDFIHVWYISNANLNGNFFRKESWVNSFYNPLFHNYALYSANIAKVCFIYKANLVVFVRFYSTFINSIFWKQRVLSVFIIHNIFTTGSENIIEIGCIESVYFDLRYILTFCYYLFDCSVVRGCDKCCQHSARK